MSPPTPVMNTEAGRYFRHVAEFIGLGEADVEAIRATRPIIRAHLPAIVTRFYTHLLRYPTTRRLFLTADGEIDEAYLVLRMRHLSNFWLRSADAVFDDDYAGYVDYVGRAHTSRGADPTIYVAERYVIGQVGMMQNAISEAVSRALRDEDDELEFQAVEAWDKLMMVILEMLARAYGHEREPETFADLVPVDEGRVADLAHRAVAAEHGEARQPTRAVAVAMVAEIPEGGRRIVEVDGLSIGIFRHRGVWIALRNHCIHRGGPVAEGDLEGDVLVCPWHGFRYDVRTGVCLMDPDAELDRYDLRIEGDRVILEVPEADPEPSDVPASPATESPAALPANEFRLATIPPGAIGLVLVEGEDVAVYNVDGTFYATQDRCPHADGPLSDGDLQGPQVTCPWHGSCFDVTSGAVLRGPATEPLRRFQVAVEGDVGRVTAAG